MVWTEFICTMCNHTLGNPFRFSELLGFGFAKLHIYTIFFFFFYFRLSFCLFSSSFSLFRNVYSLCIQFLCYPWPIWAPRNDELPQSVTACNLNSSSVICKRITCKMIFNFCLIIENSTECYCCYYNRYRCCILIQFILKFLGDCIICWPYSQYRRKSFLALPNKTDRFCNLKSKMLRLNLNA